MPSSLFKVFAISLLLFPILASAALLDVPNARTKVDFDWKPALELVWKGIKKRNIAAYNTGLVHRPKADGSIGPGDAVSEGQGYGMMMALFAGDQATFNTIWSATETYMWKGSYMNWRVNPDGSYSGDVGPATDAEQDVAAMLILADALVKNGVWQPFSLPGSSVAYAVRAQVMLNSIWSVMVESSGSTFHLRPGSWGGTTGLNPGYYTPAFYRIFADFDTNSNHKWLVLLDQGYRTMEANPGAALGLLPDWCDGAGALLPSGPGYNAYDGGKSMFKDAIRVLWRVGTDAIWFDEPRAKSFLTKSLTFINSKGGASAANFYKMDGTVVPKTDIWAFNGRTGKELTTRTRYEHSPLTIGMWAIAAMAVGTPADQESFSDEMKKFYGNGNDFFGLVSDPSGNNEDTTHNEMYFDQFLAWWGTATMAGAYSNIIYDLANPPPIIIPEATHGSLLATRMKSPRIRIAGHAVEFVNGSGQIGTMRILDSQGRQVAAKQLQGMETWSWQAGDTHGMLIADWQPDAAQHSARPFVLNP